MFETKASLVFLVFEFKLDSVCTTTDRRSRVHNRMENYDLATLTEAGSRLHRPK